MIVLEYSTASVFALVFDGSTTATAATTRGAQWQAEYVCMYVRMYVY